MKKILAILLLSACLVEADDIFDLFQASSAGYVDPWHYAALAGVDDGTNWTSDKVTIIDWNGDLKTWLAFPSNQGTNYYDYSKSFTNATPTNASAQPLWIAITNVNGDLAFDGLNDCIQVPGTRTNGLYTVTGWARTYGYTLTSGDTPYLADFRAGGGTGYVYNLYPTGILSNNATAGSKCYVNGTDTLYQSWSWPSNVWAHFCISGVQVHQSTKLTIGARNTSTGLGFFFGEMSDFKIYNRALSQAEALALYQLGSTNFGGVH